MTPAVATPKPREVVTEDMVARGLNVLAASALPEMAYETILTLAREVIEAALCDPRRCGSCGGSLWGVRADAKWCSAACRMAAYRAAKASRTRNQRRSRPGGRQISYGVAVRMLVRYLVQAQIAADAEQAQAVAERVLTRALPARQRTRARRRR